MFGVITASGFIVITIVCTAKNTWDPHLKLIPLLQAYRDHKPPAVHGIPSITIIPGWISCSSSPAKQIRTPVQIVPGRTREPPPIRNTFGWSPVQGNNGIMNEQCRWYAELGAGVSPIALWLWTRSYNEPEVPTPSHRKGSVRLSTTKSGSIRAWPSHAIECSPLNGTRCTRRSPLPGSNLEVPNDCCQVMRRTSYSLCLVNSVVMIMQGTTRPT